MSGPPGSRRRRAGRTRGHPWMLSRRSPGTIPTLIERPWPQGPGRDLDPGRAGHVRVALEMRVQLAPASSGPRSGSSRAGPAPRFWIGAAWPLESAETVPAGPARPVRIVSQHAEVESRDDVGRREGAVQVARLRHREHPHAVDPQEGSRSARAPGPCAAGVPLSGAGAVEDGREFGRPAPAPDRPRGVRVRLLDSCLK